MMSLHGCYENLLDHDLSNRSFAKNLFHQISVFTKNSFRQINDLSKYLIPYLTYPCGANLTGVGVS